MSIFVFVVVCMNLVFLACRRDTTAHELDNLLANIQAQTAAHIRVRLEGAQLRKAVEKLPR